ncbi:MAG: futalosine hydrolase [Candidatus Eremiobacteraeota bacterium]|nr:futalosine hydrolase [Candidatus Eremiobacteraeota bacterium]
MILIACAVGKELAFLKPQPHVELLVTGVGVVESAAAVSRALAAGSYDLIVGAGIAGAFEGTAEVGAGVVVSEEFIELDIENGERIALPDGARIIDRASSDLTLVDRLVELGAVRVNGLTVSRVTATDATATRLARYGAGIESMEGFAVLRAAEIAGVPAIEVRGISNIVGERTRSRWDFAAGVAGLERVLGLLLTSIGTING